jgi:hypothetical protein
MKWTPHKYQQRAIKFGVQHACAGFFMDPGMGKTTIMLAIFKLLLSLKMVRKLLVIAPLRPAQSTWPGEAAKWDEFQGLKVVVLHGADKTWENILTADISVINPEGLDWLFKTTREHIGPRGDWPWQILCVDESTRFKHANTQRFKILKPWLPKFARRYILTGTPAPNGLLDLFGQIFLLDLGHSLTPFVTHYRSAFFNPTGFGGYTWVPKKDAAGKIYKLLSPLVIRMAAEDYLELPPLVFNRVEVTLPADAQKVYDEMEALLVADVRAEKITAANAATASGKCRQIANGGLYHQVTKNGETERGSLKLHDAKTEAVKEIVEELQGTPALVAYEYDHDRERLQEAFPDAPYIGGGVAPKRFREIEFAWNAGELPILLAQPQSVAHGLNLQGTRAHIIEHSITWDLEARMQFFQRVWRQGQRFTVLVHSIVAKGTVDELVLRALKRKDATQRALLDALKEKYR